MNEGERRNILRLAARIMRRDGYAKGAKAMQAGTGPVCLLGAIGRAMNGPLTADPSYGQIYNYNKAAEVLGSARAWIWSDAQSRREDPGEHIASCLERLADGERLQDVLI